MGETIDRVLGALWNGANPFDGLPTGLFQIDIQGWNSDHPYLTDSIARIRPTLIVEIGVWKGASAIVMGHKLRELGIDGVVVAIDTWLGSWEHWVHPETGGLSFDRGHPRIYEKFSANVVACGMRQHIVPLPLDSINAAAVVAARLWRPDLIHLDGGHDQMAVTIDLAKWWALLREGGTFIGDDYYDGGRWPEVRQATDQFLARTPHENFEHENGKWRATKV